MHKVYQTFYIPETSQKANIVVVCFIKKIPTAAKFLAYQTPLSGMRISDQSVRNMLLRNLPHRRPLVEVHLAQRRQTHVTWANTRLCWTQR
jgi:hypothetical protein